MIDTAVATEKRIQVKTVSGEVIHSIVVPDSWEISTKNGWLYLQQTKKYRRLVCSILGYRVFVNDKRVF